MCDKPEKCCNNDNSLFFLIVSSIIIGIIATVLFVIGYFPNILNTLIVAVLTTLVMLLFASLLSIFGDLKCKKKCICNYTKAFITGVLGTIGATSLAVSSFLVGAARSSIVLIFLSATLFAFMCSYFYKLIICLLQEE